LAPPPMPIGSAVLLPQPVTTSSAHNETRRTGKVRSPVVDRTHNAEPDRLCNRNLQDA
jgi:hypothetical protein